VLAKVRERGLLLLRAWSVRAFLPEYISGAWQRLEKFGSLLIHCYNRAGQGRAGQGRARHSRLGCGCFAALGSQALLLAKGLVKFMRIWHWHGAGESAWHRQGLQIDYYLVHYLLPPLPTSSLPPIRSSPFLFLSICFYPLHNPPNTQNKHPPSTATGKEINSQNSIRRNETLSLSSAPLLPTPQSIPLPSPPLNPEKKNKTQPSMQGLHKHFFIPTPPQYPPMMMNASA